MRFLFGGLTAVLGTVAVMGQASPSLSVQVGMGEMEGAYSIPVQVLVLLTLLSFLPSLLISVTSFTRILLVAHFLRQALGTQTAPNNQILIGLSLFLTFATMSPTWDRIHEQAVIPYQAGTITQPEALESASGALREFMLKHVREKDLALFVRVAKLSPPESRQDLPLRVVVPAFMISELKSAFQIGFVLFLPFLVVDMVISATLLSMGMLQLPPIIISTPFKLLLFILVDGWNLVIGSLVESFQ